MPFPGWCCLCSSVSSRICGLHPIVVVYYWLPCRCCLQQIHLLSPAFWALLDGTAAAPAFCPTAASLIVVPAGCRGPYAGAGARAGAALGEQPGAEDGRPPAAGKPGRSACGHGVEFAWYTRWSLCDCTAACAWDPYCLGKQQAVCCGFSNSPSSFGTFPHPPQPLLPDENRPNGLRSVAHVIAVSSCKGGKSAVSLQQNAHVDAWQQSCLLRDVCRLGQHVQWLAC